MLTNTELQIGRSADGYVIRVEGQGNSRVSPTLAEVVMHHSEEANCAVTIVIDLSDCDYLDSTMLGSLVALHRNLNAAEQERFLLAVPFDSRNRLFGATGLATFFKFARRVPVPFEDYAPIDSICLISMEDVEFGAHIMNAHRALADTVPEGATVFGDVADRLAAELERRAR